jgi:hypothetical protein
MTYAEYEAKLQQWQDALETQQAIVREHQDKVLLCEIQIANFKERMAELKQA